MRKRIYIKAGILLLVALSMLMAGCASLRPNVWTEAARADEVIGAYTLILYGSRHISDVETVAILDKEGDQYTFEPYAPAFDYRVMKGVPAKEALDQAYRFISWHPSFYQARLSRIVDGRGTVIGYEMRPLYEPFTFGFSDVLDINYRISDSTVSVWIRLLPSVERRIENDNRPFFDLGI
jgi:hypothetical protein